MYFDSILHLCVPYYCHNRCGLLSLHGGKLLDFVLETDCVLSDLGDSFLASVRSVSVFDILLTVHRNYLYKESNKMHIFICVYSKTVLYMFRTDTPIIVRSYVSLYVQLFVHIMLTVTSCSAELLGRAASHR